MIFLKKLNNAYKEKRLIKTIIKKLYPYVMGFFLLFTLKKSEIKIFITKNKVVDKTELPLVEKIFKSYKIMKSEQNSKSELYKPSSYWQSHINESYGTLIESNNEDDIEKFMFFLQNFGNWERYTGIESQNIIKKYNKNLFLRNFLQKEMFQGQLNLWKFFNKNIDLANLEQPRFGNHIGALVENKFFVTFASFSSSIYAEILQNYLCKKKNTIMELGGGYGRVAYYIMKKKQNLTYIDVDIPETLSLASYYLSKCFPNKSTFLYGNSKIENSIFLTYDMIFLPPWEIEKISSDKVELALNQNSLGEMDPDSAKNYLKHICRTSKYFFSMNHEYFRNKFVDGKKSLVNKEYNLNGNFKQLLRYPDFGHLIYENNKIDYDSNIFFYLYKKKD